MEIFNDFTNFMIDLINSNSIYFKSKIQLNNTYIAKYVSDYEHGLFHGIMACFICYIISSDKHIKYEEINLNQIYISLLLHDFLKCNDFPQDTHDKELVNYFDKLSNITFIHSNPPESYNNNYLIISDRIELTRYSDYKDWVDEKYYNILKLIEKKNLDLINDFYKNIRPLLLQEYINIKDLNNNFDKLVNLIKDKLKMNL